MLELPRPAGEQAGGLPGSVWPIRPLALPPRVWVAAAHPSAAGDQPWLSSAAPGAPHPAGAGSLHRSRRSCRSSSAQAFPRVVLPPQERTMTDGSRGSMRALAEHT